MIDDILDLTGSSDEMGKPMLKDLQNNVSNIVVIHALAHADARTGTPSGRPWRGAPTALGDWYELAGDLRRPGVRRIRRGV